MVTLLFSMVGLTFEIKGTIPKDLKPDCFFECEVIGIGLERINMAQVYAIRELNPEEHKNYKTMVDDFNRKAMVDDFNRSGLIKKGFN